MDATLTGSCLVYGTGGHARVVASLATATGLQVLAYFDDVPRTSDINGIPVQHYDVNFRADIPLITGIGNNKVRKLIAEKSMHVFTTLVHPTASVAPDVVIGKGSVILAGAVLQANASIGKQVVVNINAAIDHDVVVEDYVSIYPGAYIGGGAVIGEGASIGPNCVIMRNARVPAWADVPAGTVLA